MTTVEPKLSDRQPRRRFQFSLGQLLIVITVLCVVLATFGQDWWFVVFVACSNVFLLCLVTSQVHLACTGCSPGNRLMVRYAAAATGTVLFVGLLAIVSPRWSAAIWRPTWLLSLIAAPNLPHWLTAWSTYKVLKQSPGNFSPTQVRRAAAITVTLFIAAYLCALPITFGNLQMAAFILTFTASLAMSAPWIQLLRIRATAGQAAWSAFESVSLALLVGSLLAMLVAASIAAFCWLFKGSIGLGAILLLVVFVCMLPLGSLLFAAAFLIELWRDRWHGWLTGLSGVLLGVCWLACFIAAAFS